MIMTCCVAGSCICLYALYYLLKAQAAQVLLCPICQVSADVIDDIDGPSAVCPNCKYVWRPQ